MKLLPSQQAEERENGIRSEALLLDFAITSSIDGDHKLRITTSLLDSSFWVDGVTN